MIHQDLQNLHQILKWVRAHLRYRIKNFLKRLLPKAKKSPQNRPVSYAYIVVCTYLYSESIYILKACAAKKRAELFRFWGLDGQALASGCRPRVFHLEPPSWSLSSLYFPLGREMPVDEKWKHREKEGNTHTLTLTQRKREKGAEQKHRRQNGFHSRSSRRPEVPYFSSFTSFSSFLASFHLVCEACCCAAFSNHIKDVYTCSTSPCDCSVLRNCMQSYTNPDQCSERRDFHKHTQSVTLHAGFLQHSCLKCW